MSVSIKETMTERPPCVDEVLESEGVVKLRVVLADGERVESVLIPDGDGHSLCISTQVGCRMGCAFCATGRMGFVRDLAAEEIALQARVAAEMGRKPDKLVFMGMGEPFDNYDAWRAAVELMIESRRKGGERPSALGSTRRMTVSTCGHVDGMARFAREGFKRMGFALSLNAPCDEIRSELMPVNRRWGMEALRDAVLKLPLRGGVVLVEYVLLAGVNDSPVCAERLAGYLRPLRCLVNLLAYNPIGERGPDWLATPTEEAVDGFQRRLAELGVFVTRRESRGLALAAACGQLATRE